MSNSLESNSLKDSLLTETYCFAGDNTTDPLYIELDAMVQNANKDLADGQLYLNTRTCMGTLQKATRICSRLNILDSDTPNLDPQHYNKLVQQLYYTTRGFVMTLNEQLDEEKKTIPLHEFAECVVRSTIENIQGMSKIAERFDQKAIVQDVINGINKLDGVIPVDAGTYLPEGRLMAFSFILDDGYWWATCKAAIQEVIKEMDAKAVRIALKMGMDAL